MTCHHRCVFCWSHRCSVGLTKAWLPGGAGHWGAAWGRCCMRSRRGPRPQQGTPRKGRSTTVREDDPAWPRGLRRVQGLRGGHLGRTRQVQPPAERRSAGRGPSGAAPRPCGASAGHAGRCAVAGSTPCPHSAARLVGGRCCPGHLSDGASETHVEPALHGGNGLAVGIHSITLARGRGRQGGSCAKAWQHQQWRF